MKYYCYNILIVFSIDLWKVLANVHNVDNDIELDGPVVKTKYGPVQGVVRKGHYEFRGIPYMKPALGELRYQEPREPDPWTDTFHAKTFPEYCIQYNSFWRTTEGEEDCLYLNVFTPSVPSEDENNSTILLPVMVYIHSGGFMFGRGSQFRGDYLMEHKNAVLVVFHYRLGSFGYLNTEDEISMGNMGMKDQVRALHFVQENIANFGGDKNRVMIFGTSAGSASVHYHILSPMSKGLFHSAYSGSGSAINPWAFQYNPKKNAERLGSMLGCPTGTSLELVKCLRTKDAHEVAQSHSLFQTFYSDPIAAFGPSIEVGNPSQNTRFLSNTPMEIISNGEVNEVPWMIGFDTDEGYEHTLGILKDPKLVKKLNEDWQNVFPVTLEYVNEKGEQQAEISKRVREFYFGNEPINPSNPRNLSNAYSDKVFILGIVEAAVLHAQKQSKEPVYLFKFAYEGEHSIVTLKGHPREGFVANHMDDIQYLLDTFLFPRIDTESKDRKFQQKFLNLVVKFCATGKVSPFDEDSSDQLWKPLNKDGTTRYYHITSSPAMKPISDDLKGRLQFWNSFPLREHITNTLLTKDEL